MPRIVCFFFGFFGGAVEELIFLDDVKGFENEQRSERDIKRAGTTTNSLDLPRSTRILADPLLCVWHMTASFFC
jgi:hypothetical protein